MQIQPGQFVVKYRMANEYKSKTFTCIENARRHVDIIHSIGWPARIQTSTGRVY